MMDMPLSRLKLYEIILLVLGTAIGLSLIRVYYETPSSYSTSHGYELPIYPSVNTESIVTSACACLVTWSSTLFALGICASPQRFSIRMRSLGFSGSVATVFVTSLMAIMTLVRGYHRASGSADMVFAIVFNMNPRYVGVGIGTTWLCQLLGGEYERPANWRDRFGMALGALWIAVWIYI